MSNPLIVMAGILECCDDENLEALCQATPDSYCDVTGPCIACPFFHSGTAKEAAKAMRLIGEKIEALDEH